MRDSIDYALQSDGSGYPGIDFILANWHPQIESQMFNVLESSNKDYENLKLFLGISRAHEEDGAWRQYRLSPDGSVDMTRTGRIPSDEIASIREKVRKG